MEVNKINYQAFQTLKKHIPFPSATQQKVIMVAALIILGGAALCYTFSLIIKKFHLLNKNSEEETNSNLISTILIREGNPAILQNQLVNPPNNDFPSENNCIPQVAMLSPEDSFEKSFKENISLYANTLFKNATSLDEAQVIVIGEKHNIPEHRKLEGMILKCFGKANDILLLEGTINEEKEAADPSIFFSREVKKFIPKKIRAFGWEKDLDTFNKEGMMINQTYSYVQKYINASNNADKSKIEEEMLKLEQDIFIEHSKRNDFLISLIKENMNKHPNCRIFVMAGSVHVLHKENYDFSTTFLKKDTPNLMYTKIFDFNIMDHLPTEAKAAAVILKNKFPLIT